MYRPSTSFADRSNRQAKQERVYCAKHLLARPSREPNGQWPERCWTGNEVNEACQIMIVKPDGSEVEYVK